MKKKGRFVLEASLLVPGICILIVHIVFFTLYAHDYAVCVHTAVQSGVKGSYPDGRSNAQIIEDVERDIKQKLSERLLWLRQKEVSVQADSVRLTVRIYGTGSFLPVEGIDIQQEIYRIQPCETVRRCRWLGD